MFVILLRNFCYFCLLIYLPSVQFSSVAQSCSTLCDSMNSSTPDFPVHHQLPEFTQTHLHRVSDAIQPSHPLSSPSPAPNPSHHQGLFQWVNSLNEVVKVLEFQPQHQSFQWTPRTEITENGSICFVHLMSMLWFSGVGQQWQWLPYQQLQFKEADLSTGFLF